MANTTADKLQKALDNKAAIKAAIEAKNPEVMPTDVMSQWPTSIGSIPEGGGFYPHEWKNDGKTHLWFFYEPMNTHRFCYFYAQYIAPSGFTVDYGDGTVATIAASTALTARALSHTYAAPGEYEVTISGYTQIRLVATPFNNGNMGYYSSIYAIRQAEIAGKCDMTGNWNGSQTVLFKADGFSGNLPANAFQANPFMQSFPEIDASTISSIGNSGFEGCNQMDFGDVEFPELTAIGSNVFWACGKLPKDMRFPKLKTAGQYAFQYSNIETLDLPAYTNQTGSYGAFCGATKLKSFNAPNLTAVHYSMFYGCTSLSDVGSFDSVKVVNGWNSFSNCTSLSAIPDMPSLTAWNGAASLQDSTNLTSIGDMPLLQTANDNSPFKCPSLVHIGNTDSLLSCNKQLFYNDTKLVFSKNQFPSVKFVGTDALYQCDSEDHEMHFPSLSSFGSTPFSNFKAKKIWFNGTFTSFGSAQSNLFSSFSPTHFYGLDSLSAIPSGIPASMVLLDFGQRPKAEIEAIATFTNIPARATCVVRCLEGDHYRSGSQLVPV